ncbi:acetyl-CoA carboxylase biotin carboxyl carrier protein [Ruminococcus sp.]|uniref:acetyl-CoA carboxylase biotin carboxyl carrier protein n=1 Tax=Ruminococcus sp. TaxID=41978 RepID=UPI0025F9FB67|nr:acetyl-CoA carboxylase biotin carboxyl carrier protein [Ruminococcus sp.]
MSEKIYNMVDLDTIEKLADIVAEKDLGEITIVDGGKTITVKGKKCPSPMPSMGMMPQAVPAAVTAAPAASAETPAAPKPQGKAIKAPLVGTFYAAPSPDQPPFVQVGDTVKKGDVVLIIESMKLMNEVTSDVDGVVQEILVKNGEAVEYDQPLMILS